MTRSRIFASPRPTVAVEIAARRVTAVSIARRGDGALLAHHATEPLPPEAVAPALTTPNIADRAAVTEALKRALGRLAGRPRRVALVVPDVVAKVSLVRFDKRPPRADDLEQLLRWQVRKTAPFRVEEAQLAYTPGGPPAEGGHEFVVVLARRDIVAEYEAVCAGAGVHAGVVDLATFNLINLALAAAPHGERDWLLVHVTLDYTTIAIVRGPHLVFFRTRQSDTEGELADLVHQTAMYYEDRLGGAGFGRILLCGASSLDGRAGEDGIRRELETRLGTPVESIDPRQVVSLPDRISAGPALLDSVASPLGLLLREQAA
jgi:type IV pilus assembly protein PilM